MRNCSILTIGFLLASSAPCSAQDGKPQPGTITVIGAATVPVQPDSVRVTFGHQVRLSGLKEARAESDKQVKKINDALQALKLDTIKIVTATENLQVILSSNPGAAAPVPDMPQVPIGYQVRTSFTVTAKAKDMDKLRDIAKRVTDAAVESGANLGPNGSSVFRDEMMLGGGGGGGPGFARGATSRTFVPSIELLKEDTSDARNQAIGAAVKNALATAEALAKGANSKIRKIYAISEESEPIVRVDPNEYYDSYSSIFGTPRQDQSALVRATSITVRVRVICSIE